jgi:rare lipoprotein A
LTRHRIAKLAAVLGTAALATVPAAPAGADGAGPSLFTRPGGLLGQTLRLRGGFDPAEAGHTVQVQRRQPDGTWAPAVTATVGPDGAFLARWRPDTVGLVTFRAVLPSAQADAQAAGAGGVPLTSVVVYRPALATWYGPGFYGKHTACGQRMTHSLLGIAHRSLPCGTPVTLFRDGQSITVPVVDRGPFANGARYDLTSAAAQQLGLTETSVIGVLPQRGAQLAAPAPAPAPPPGSPTGGTGYSP